MGTLAGCLKKLAVPDEQAKLIRKAAKEARGDGDTNLAAIQSLLGDTRRQKKSIVQQIYDAMDEGQRAAVFTASQKPARSAEVQAEVPTENLPAWVTDDFPEQTSADSRPSLTAAEAKKVKQAIAKLRRGDKVDDETLDAMLAMDPLAAKDILDLAESRAALESEHILGIRDDYNQLIVDNDEKNVITWVDKQGKKRQRKVSRSGELSAKARLIERRGGDYTEIVGFDVLVDAVESGHYPDLQGHAYNMGGGDASQGLFEIIQGGIKQFQAFTSDLYVQDAYDDIQRATRETVDEGTGTGQEWDEEPGSREVGDDAEAADVSEADDFQLTRDAAPPEFKAAKFEDQPPATQKAFVSGRGKDDPLQDALLFDTDGIPSAKDDTLFQEDDSSSTTSLKNATIDRERSERGLSPIVKPARLDNQQAWDDAMRRIGREPEWQDSLEAEIKAKPRATTPQENAALLHRRITLRHEHDSALAQWRAAKKSGDVAAIADADWRVSVTGARLHDFEEVTEASGTWAGRALQARKMMAEEDYTLAKMEMQASAAKGRALTGEELSKLEEQQRQIADLQEQLDEANAKREQRAIDAGGDETLRRAEQGNKKRIGKKKPAGSADPMGDILDKLLAKPAVKKTTGKKTVGERASEAKSALKDSLARMRKLLAGKSLLGSTGFDPELASAAAEVAVNAVRAGSLTFAKYVQIFSKEFGADVTRKLSGYLQDAWTKLGQRVKGLNSASSVDAILDAKPYDPAMGDSPAVPRRQEAFLDTGGETAKPLASIKRKVAKGDAYAIHNDIQKLAIAFWGQGVREREAMIDAIHAVIEPMMGKDWTRDLTRRAFSGYGDFKPLSKDEAVTGVADIKTQIQQTLKMDAIIAGVPLEKTGIERRPLTDEGRRLVKQVNELKRKHGVVVTDPASQLKSALDARMTYYTHRMADLKYEIDTRHKIIKERSDSPTDPDLEALIAEYNQVKADHAAIFTKPGLTDKQRMDIALKAAERNEAYWEGRLKAAKNGVYDAQKQKRRPLTSDELELSRAYVAYAKEAVKELKALDTALQETAKEDALDKRITELKRQIATGEIDPKKQPKASAADTEAVAKRKEELAALEQRKKELLDVKYPPKTRQEIANQSLRTRLAQETIKLKEKIAAGDFTVQPRTKLVRDDETNRMQAEADLLRAKFKEGVAADRWARSSIWTKGARHAADAWDIIRSAMTTGEFSFFLRQGKWYVAGHPIRSAGFLAQSLKAFANEETALAIQNEIRNHPKFDAYRAAKGHFSDENSPLTKQEEFAIGRFIKKIPLLGNFARSGRVFLNKVRFDLFVLMEKTLSKSGTGTEEELRQFAMFANESTGRGGLGSMEKSSVELARFFFSPRYLASRFQLLAGHSLWGGSSRTRKVIAREYARSLIGLAAYYSVLAWAFGNDDEEVSFSLDPSQSDFLKLRVGDTYVDPFAGVQQVAVLLSRTGLAANAAFFGDDQAKAYQGREWRDVASQFVWTKFHPSINKIADILSQHDLVGNKVTPTSAALSSIQPITWGDMLEAMQEHGYSTGTALSTLAFMGEGIQTYNKLDPKVGDDPKKHALKLAKRAEGYGKPQRKSNPAAYPQRFSKWYSDKAAAQKWIDKHKDQPEVQAAVREVRKKKLGKKVYAD